MKIFKLLPLLLLLAWPVAVQSQNAYSTNADSSIYTYSTNKDGSANIVFYAGPPWTVTIPNTINGLLVTTIGQTAFDSSGLTSVIIPDSVVDIGASAFFDCFSLTNVIIGNGVTNIEAGAFEGCGNLTGITIPNSVTSIGGAAFYDCTNLTYAAIGGNVANIGYDAFAYCKNLTSIIIPDNVTNIGSELCKSCASLTNAIIGNNVTSIGVSSFEYCSNLTSVEIGNSVASIGISAFEYCGNLTGVMIGNSVTNIGQLAFYRCTSLISITIPKSVNGMGLGVFGGCTNLTSVYFKGNFFTTPAEFGANNLTIYYLPGTTGWTSSFAGYPTKLWNPQAQTGDGFFGVQNNKFGFNITGSSNLVIVVGACTNLNNPVWSPVSTNTLNAYVGTNGTSYFSDPQWTNYPGRFYRFRSP